MANRFSTPNPQFCDATGLPYAGGSLAFYASGTSTPLATYSDKALTTPNTNPVVLDSAGRPTGGNIFLQNLAYKVVLSDSLSNVIWTEDPVYTSDFSATAQFQSGNGSPNGTTAGTAGSATIAASSYWDFTNNILYVCTQTGTTSTAVWTAVNSGAATNIIPAPQGRLTPTSGTPVIATDSSAATQIYYTPYVGNLIPIYNGTTFSALTFAELGLTLVSAHAANTVYDVFVFSNSGVLTAVTGPAWSSSTPGSCSRGTGAGTTQISLLSGFWVNTVSMTARNGATTYTVPANQATYVGSIYIDNTAGQVSCLVSFGQNRKWGIWNAYNRKAISLIAGDATSSWAYATATFRASRNIPASYTATEFNVGSGTPCNGLVVFMGLSEEYVDLQFNQSAGLDDASGVAAMHNIETAIGINSITVASGKYGFFAVKGIVGQNPGGQGTLVASYGLAPTIGLTNVAALEQGNASATTAFFGSSLNMALTAKWMG